MRNVVSLNDSARILVHEAKCPILQQLPVAVPCLSATFQKRRHHYRSGRGELAKWPTESGAGVLAQVVLTMKIETCVSSAPAIGHAAAADL
jgi:hypothetical protein